MALRQSSGYPYEPDYLVTHEMLVSGYGLDHLLADLAAQRVVSLHEPHRADKFRAADEPELKGAINELVVREINDEA